MNWFYKIYYRFDCVLLMRANATKILYVRVGEMLNICSVGWCSVACLVLLFCVLN